MPPPRSRSCGTVAWMTFITPKTLVSKICWMALSRRRLEDRDDGDAGIVDDGVEAAEAPDARLNGGVDARGIGHIERLDEHAIRVFVRQARAPACASSQRRSSPGRQSAWRPICRGPTNSR